MTSCSTPVGGRACAGRGWAGGGGVSGQKLTPAGEALKGGEAQRSGVGVLLGGGVNRWSPKLLLVGIVLADGGGILACS